MSSNTVRGALFASLSAIAAFANIAVAVPAHAAERQAAPTVTVRYADLDLRSDAGVAHLNRRVTFAAKGVCGSSDIRDLPASAWVSACRNQAIAGAAQQIASAVAVARGTTFAANAPAADIRVAAR